MRVESHGGSCRAAHRGALQESALRQRPGRAWSARGFRRRSGQYIAARRLRTQALAQAAPPRRPLPKGFQRNLHAPLRGLIIFIRRTDETGRARLLGQPFAVSPDWPHRLVRCEVDFDHLCISCFALRRAAPTEQLLPTTIPYQRPDKPFKVELRVQALSLGATNTNSRTFSALSPRRMHAYTAPQVFLRRVPVSPGKAHRAPRIVAWNKRGGCCRVSVQMADKVG